MPAVLEAEEAVEQGKYAEAAALYAVELAKVRRFTSSFTGSVFASSFTSSVLGSSAVRSRACQGAPLY